jgi:membrane protein CcdC involved in cytochrome C biogenesis
MKPAASLAVILLGLVAVLHAIRLTLQLEILVGGVLVPMWVSVFGVLVPGALAIWLWREQQSAG